MGRLHLKAAPAMQHPGVQVRAQDISRSGLGVNRTLQVLRAGSGGVIGSPQWM